MRIKFLLIKCLTALILGGVSNISIAQAINPNLSGTIIDEAGLPISKASIYIKELKKTVQTDATGKYFIKDIKHGTYTLNISHVGRKPQVHSITIYRDEVADFALLSEPNNLSEVLITATQTMNERPVSIGKVAINPLDLPQSVTVIGNEVIKQQQSQRLSDVIKNVNGVYLGTTRASASESFYARGYRVSNDNMFKNGFRVNAGAMPEMSSLEKVEILKGSAAILYGSVAPGGIINMVTKQPKFESGIEVAVRTGSNDLYKPMFDIYGPISSRIAYRLNGTYERAGSFRQNVNSERYYINPSLLVKLGAKTDFLVQGDYLKHEFTPDFGTAAINGVIVDIPRSTFLGASWSNAIRQQATTSISLNHHFNKVWQLNANISYQLHTYNYQSTERIQPDAKGNWSRPLGKSRTHEDYYSTQINLTGKFATGTIKHTLLVGSDADSYLNTSRTYVKDNKYLDANSISQSITSYDKTNVLNPTGHPLRTDMPLMNPFNVIVAPSNQFGIYINDLITISENIKVLAGLRWSYQNALPVKNTELDSSNKRNFVIFKIS